MSQVREKYPIRSKDTCHRILGDEAIVVNFNNSLFYNFNSVGTFIWVLCDGQHSLTQIIQALAVEYEVAPQTAYRDCRQFIEELAEQGLLSWSSSAEAAPTAPKIRR